jgi:putative ABC transport system permease protein
MIRNYLTIALRFLIKNKLYSAINIIGLAVGLAACILIMLFVRDELSYDHQWANADTIGRINTTVLIPGRASFVSVSASSPMKEALESFFPDEVVRATRFIPMHPVVSLDGKAFAEDMHWTDPETARMFDLNVLKGDIDAALRDKSSLAVSESFARKYFGENDAIDGILNIKVHDIERDYRIGAVFEDLPHNTSLDFHALARFDLNDFPTFAGAFDTWLNLGEHLVYVQVNAPHMLESVNARLPELVDSRVIMPDSLKSSADAPTSDSYIQTVQSLKDIHLNPSGMGEMKPSGNIRTVRIFIAAAGLVLLIACINFMNLATANSTQRALEVALRKVVGAKRSQLVTQFLGESVVLGLLGLAAGLLLVELALPVFNSILNTPLDFAYGDGFLLLFLLGIVLIVGLAAGAYPALILSGFLPARVLASGWSSATAGSVNLRNFLVVIQFVISICLIVATATVFTQSYYVTHTNLGYSKDNVLVLNNVNHQYIADRKISLKEAIQKLPGVTNAGFTDYSPIDIHERLTVFQVVGESFSQSAMISSQAVDHDFLETYKIPLVAGRFYQRGFVADGMPDIGADPEQTSYSGTVVINEESVRQLGLDSPEAAIGRHVTTSFGPTVTVDLQIIGVTPDIHFQSPKKPIRAEVYLLAPQRFNTLAIRYDGSGVDLVGSVEKVWNSFTNRVPFQYEFVDETIAAEFEKERNLAVVLTGFSLMIVLVACLGLYGLAAFTAERRTKEIGIRKVMGASVMDIVRLLLWQFSKPVLLANLIAWPLSAWMMLRWLETFPIHLDSWLLLPFCLGAGAIAILIAWVTVGSNTAQVARAKPVDALRYE